MEVCQRRGNTLQLWCCVCRGCLGAAGGAGGEGTPPALVAEGEPSKETGQPFSPNRRQREESKKTAGKGQGKRVTELPARNPPADSIERQVVLNARCAERRERKSC